METGRILKERYRILEKIGSGGMADVYLAYDTVLDRKVAVKVMHRQYAADENFVRRFRREAQAAANLNHPNIVSVYDWGHENETYFIVMEYITGKPLKDLILSKGVLNLNFAIDIAKQIARALAFAHKHEVVHRDIKPQNIIITQDGLVKVTDFGIARAKSSSLTETGTVMGSVHYLAPEQAQGLPATELSDIYSMGVILFEMVTGNVPFEGDTPVSIAMKHASETPPRPSSLNSSLPPKLEAIILKAMAKDPFDRYQNADELLSDLKRIELGKPVEAAGPSHEKTMVISPKNITIPKKRRRLITIITTILILMLAGGAIAGLWYYQSQLAAKITKVPKLVDLEIKQAEKLLEERELKMSVGSKEYSETYAAGKVISQDPEPGAEVEKGTTVTVVVSKGEKPIKVPDITGKSEIEAGRILGELGLRIGDIKYEFSDKIPEGAILKQSPAAGTEVTRSAEVDIVISRGVEVVIVPDVEELSLEKAKEIISKAGLKVETTEEESVTVEKGRVIRQSPSAGDTIKKGEKVLLVVSTGPSVITVPNVVGLTSLEARNKLESLKLAVETQNVEVFEEDKVGKVLQQSPNADQKVTVGTTVTIWVGE